MADLRDFTGKNRKFTGTIGERISTGTTVDRDVSFGQGTLRFNTTTSLMEYYDGTQWKPIDAPPTIASISPATFASDGSTLFTITVTGSNFGIGCTAKFIGNDATQYTPGTVTRVSSSSVTMTTLTTMTIANEPYDIQITNASGLSATLENALDAGSSPAFTVGAGTLGTLTNGNRAATALTSQTFGPATDADGQQINYTITSGSISPGLRLGTANDGNNGKILGTATAVGSNTTSTFTITATDGVNTASRQYSITVNAPVVETFTANGTFTVPAGITEVDVLVVAGGGGGGGDRGSGGGAGGLIYRPGFSVTPGGSVSVTVGDGGAGGPGNSRGSTGSDSLFGTLTSKGGGAGNNAGSAGGFGPTMNGGSGGGSSCQGTAGTGNQPSQPGDSGSFGFGNNGGSSTGIPSSTAGGGGAGAVGGNISPGPGTPQGAGGIGKQYDISGSNTYYAGGGGGGKSHPTESNKAAGAGGLGGGATGGVNPGESGGTGTANTGGGGGGGAQSPIAPGGPGGKGVVIVRY